MNENSMTTEDTWQKHWSGRDYVQYISSTYSYHDVINQVSHKVPIGGTCIELGGFPGYFSIYFKKYCGLVPTLIDFYFDKKIFTDIIDFNELSESDICCIKDDVFTHSPNNRYDLVASFGLIEHFADPYDILRAHIKYMKPGGILLIGLPNFKGINGLLQKYFDPENLSIHNLDVMNLALIKNNLEHLGLLEVDVSYYPSTQVWIENIADRGIIINIIVRLVGKITKFLGFLFGQNNKILSNSIIATARAPK